MSINRLCKECGLEEPIRFNFGSNREAEREFHAQPYLCPECKENEEFFQEMENTPKEEVIARLQRGIAELEKKLAARDADSQE